MSEERRAHARHKVFGGNAEIQSVFGRGKKPGDRARIIDWSRGGFMIKVKSPRRRFIVQKADPVLFEDDKVQCTLRLPPSYKDVFVNADVVHVERIKKEPEYLLVGLAFDMDNTSGDKLDLLAKVLEPRARSKSGRIRKSSRLQQRVASDLGPASEMELPAVKKASGRSKKVSARNRKVSGRSQRQTERLPKALS